MNESLKGLLVVLALGVVGLAFLWVPLPGGIPLFLLSYLLLFVLPGFVLISYFDPEMSMVSRLVYGFVISLALLFGMFFVVALLELYSLVDYLPSFLLVLSILVALASYLGSGFRDKADIDQGQLTLFEAIERAQRVRDLVNHEVDVEPASGEPAISGVYKAQVEEPVPIQEEDTAPKRIRMDVKPLQEEHLQNSFLEEEPEVEVSHPMWRDGLPRDGGFIYWDLLATLFLLVACTGFLLLDPLKRPVYLTIFFLLGYALVVLLYPAPGRLALAKRVGATILLGLLVLGVSYLLWIRGYLASLPLFYILAIFTLVTLLVGGFRRRFASREEEALEEDTHHEEMPEVIELWEELDEKVFEEEPVIIPDHVVQEEEHWDEDLEDIVPEVVALREILETNKEEVVTREEQSLDDVQEEDIEELIPEIVALKKMVLPDEEEEVSSGGSGEDVIVPDHVFPVETSTLRTRETESKALREEPAGTSDAPLEEPIQQRELSTDKKQGLVLPWIGREKRPVHHVYENKPHHMTPQRIGSGYPLDLILVVISTLLTVAFVLIPVLNQTPVRTVLGILLVLFLPGYSLIAALFPRRGDLDSVERVALSFGLSIAVTPLIGLVLNYTPWGIRLDPILVGLAGFTLIMCLISHLRRRSLSDDEKFIVAFG